MSELAMNAISIVTMVLLALAFWAAYRWWRRYMETRGSLELDLPDGPLQPNGTVDGVIRLQAGKRDLGPGKVVVSLIFKKTWQERRRGENGDQIVDKEDILYRHDVDVATDFSLHAGNSQTLRFTLPIPAADIDTTPSSGFGRFAQTVGSFSKSNEQQFWLIDGRYDVRGLDLQSGRVVSIDFPRPAPPPPSDTSRQLAPPPSTPPPPPAPAP